jgi:hypothetical protein
MQQIFPEARKFSHLATSLAKNSTTFRDVSVNFNHFERPSISLNGLTEGAHKICQSEMTIFVICL